MNYDNHFSTGTHYDAIECPHKLCPFCDECHTTGCHNYYQPCEELARYARVEVQEKELTQQGIRRAPVISLGIGTVDAFTEE